MWNRIGSLNSGATHQSPLVSRVPMIQVEGPPPELVTLGRTIKSTTALTSWAQDYPYPTSADTTELYLMRDAGSALRRRGTIGLIRIYNTALTNAELLQNYNATKTRFGVS